MGGHLRKSAHFDKIDAVMGCRKLCRHQLSNVKEAGSTVSEQEETVKDQGDCIEKKEARTSTEGKRPGSKREKRKTILKTEICFGPSLQAWKSNIRI